MTWKNRCGSSSRHESGCGITCFLPGALPTRAASHMLPAGRPSNPRRFPRPRYRRRPTRKRSKTKMARSRFARATTAPAPAPARSSWWGYPTARRHVYHLSAARAGISSQSGARDDARRASDTNISVATQTYTAISNPTIGTLQVEQTRSHE